MVRARAALGGGQCVGDPMGLHLGILAGCLHCIFLSYLSPLPKTLKRSMIVIRVYLAPSIVIHNDGDTENNLI